MIPVDLSTNTLLAGISAPNVNAFCGHPSQPLVYASSDGTGRVVEINTSTNAATARSFPVTGGHVQQCAVSADGSAIYIRVEDADLFVYDLTTGAQRPTIVGGGGFGAAMTADGTQLWVASRATVKIIDLALGTIRRAAAGRAWAWPPRPSARR